MKKIFVVFLLMVIGMTSVFAQKKFEEADVSYVNVPVLKVLEHTKAYVIIYQKNGNDLGCVSIPKQWFKQGSPEKKAKLRAIDEKINPYVCIYFRNGEFDYLYLNMPKSKANAFWGVLPNGSKLPKEIDPFAVAAGK